jgi:hypothetical protein
MRACFCISYDSSYLTPFTYFLSSDRDAKKRFSSNWSVGGLGGQMLTGVVKNSVGRVFGS